MGPDTEKMNLITVKMFDKGQGIIMTRLLDLYSTTGKKH